MGDALTTLDYVFFFVALFGVMIVGLIAGRKEETSEDYFLAGRSIPWWGVAGSIYGSNVSANHMVGMMGVGFTIGFAQSHFELGAILGLMVLCYGFLPVYRKLRLYTLSEYLEQRYDHRSRLAYSIIMTVIMAVIHLVPGLYIGSRTICTVLGGDATEEVVVDAVSQQTLGELKASEDGTAASGVAPVSGNAEALTVTKLVVNWNYYAIFVIALAFVSAGYTIFGGLKAVVWTDFIQSMLLLAAGLLIAFLTFQELGGWGEMMAFDQAADAAGGNGRMHLYLPTNHPALPWTGVFTGLMAMHCFYWGTNQFIVQRALGARSDSDAKLGIIAAGFLKLLIPFFAIGTGVAAFYLFHEKMPERQVASDSAFSELVPAVIPAGLGLIGLIFAGLIGAILSSIDSMMNSAATLFTIDVYKRYFRPDASDADMIRVGRLAIVVFVVSATLMALFVLDPNSEGSFFLTIVDYQNYLTPGLLVAFLLGMFWKRGTATAAFITIAAGIAFSWVAEAGYNSQYGMAASLYQVASGAVELDSVKLSSLPDGLKTASSTEIIAAVDAARASLNPVNRFLGPSLNFFHRVVFVLLFSGICHVVVSFLTRPDPVKSRLNWVELGGHTRKGATTLLTLILVSLVVFAVFAIAMVKLWLSPTSAASLGAIWTLVVFQSHIFANRRTPESASADSEAVVPIIRDDRFWASLLCSAAVFMHYFYY